MMNLIGTFILFCQEKSMYSGFDIERMGSYDTPVYRINKKDTNAPIFLAFKTIEALLKAERAIISLATGKSPKAIFRYYMDVLIKMVNNSNYIVLTEKNKFSESFAEETYTNFADGSRCKTSFP